MISWWRRRKEEKIGRMVHSKLVELGATSDEVESSLNKLGISGEPNNYMKCPIANYVNSILPNGYFSTIGDVTAVIFDSKKRLVALVDNPSPVVRFIHKFDDKEIELDG